MGLEYSLGIQTLIFTGLVLHFQLTRTFSTKQTIVVVFILTTKQLCLYDTLG